MRGGWRWGLLISALGYTLATRPLSAQPAPADLGSAEGTDAPAPYETSALAEPLAARASADKKAPWLLSGYVEADYQWNFAKPDNGITNYRGFDNRANTFTVSNVQLSLDWDYQDVVGKIALQVGHTPSTYYLSEPDKSGTPGSNATNRDLWKYIQQAYVGYRVHPWDRELVIQAGVFLSPIGPESMIVHDNWNWSRSNLFFGLPFYHTGARATQSVTDAWSLTVAVFNGWNSVVDNNAQKSLLVQSVYAPSEALSWTFQYFGGVERAAHAPEGAPFRHMLDTYATWHATRWLSMIGQANVGFEPNRFGLTRWGAGALSLRAKLHEQLSLALRGDRLQERPAHDAQGTAQRIFFPARWVSEGTATLDYHPTGFLSLRLEYRHDAAGSPLYFRRRVPMDGTPNARQGNTLTLGLTAWF